MFSRVLSLSIVTLFFVATHAYSATFNVNNTADAVDANPGNGVCATTGGACTLRAAIMEANASGAEDIINLPDGVYELSLLGTGEDVAATGDLDILSTLTINGTSRAGTIINGLSADRIFHVFNPAVFTVNNLSIINGLEAGNPGGGISCTHDVPLTIQNVMFENNVSTSGGAIYTVGPINIDNSIFSENTAGTAGTILAASATGPYTITNSTISDNSGSTVAGVYIAGDGNTTISNTIFERNNATTIGALFVVTPTGQLNITNSLFDRNVANTGTAIYTVGDGPTVITNSVISNNRDTSSSIGAILATGVSKNLTITNTTFSNNAGAMGGADIYSSSTNGSFTLTDVDISGSTCVSPPGCSIFASGGAGAVATLNRVSIDNAYSFSGTTVGMMLTNFDDAVISNSSFTNNTSFTGTAGGIFAVTNNTLLLEDSTVAGNQMKIAGTVAGAYLSAPVQVNVRRSSFFDNRTQGGATAGGLFIAGTNGLIHNTTFSNNFSGSVGGGIHNGVTNLEVKNSTLAGNTALAAGDSIFNGGTIAISNSIISGSPLSNHCTGGVFTSNGNNIESTNTCNFIGASDQVNTNPQLSALTMVGLTTLSTSTTSSSMLHIPLIGSPAIDNGNNASCSTVDQRSLTRPFDGDQNGIATCDIGAVEFNDFCPNDDTKQFAGQCGCGVPDADSDGDGTVDCNESCDNDPNKTSPGVCGCGVSDVDADGSGQPDCLAGNEVADTTTQIDVEANRVRCSQKNKVKKEARARIKTLLGLVDQAESLANANASSLVFASGVDLNSFTGALSKLEKKLKKLRNASKKGKTVNLCKKFRRQMRKANAGVQANKPVG